MSIFGEEKFQPRRDSYSLAGFSLSSANLRSEETNDFQSYDAMHACISPERGNIFVTIVIQSVFLPSRNVSRKLAWNTENLWIFVRNKVVARYRGFMGKEENLLKIFVAIRVILKIRKYIELQNLSSMECRFVKFFFVILLRPKIYKIYMYEKN